jgi:hypothetical protein
VLHLIDEASGDNYIFSTYAWGGRIALIELARKIESERAKRPGVRAVVELSAADMETKSGKQLRPDFNIVDWKSSQRILPTEELMVRTRDSDLSDDIPF